MRNLIETSNTKTAELALRLPDTAYTRSGIRFNPNEDIWDWHDGPFHLYIDFRKVDGEMAHFREPLKHALLVFAKGSSAHHLSNLFHAFMHFLSRRDDSISLQTITAAAVSNYNAQLAQHEKGRLSTLNVLLQKWFTLGLSGIDGGCAQYLRERRKQGNVKGAAVRTRDPVEGPFSEAEYSELYKAVDAAYGMGEIPLWVVILTRLLFATGGRISQCASLKLMDLVVQQESFVLKLPQVKNREAHARVLFKDFDLSPQTGRLVQEHIDQLMEAGHDENYPMFPQKTVMSKGAVDEYRSEQDLFFGHCTAANLARVYTKMIEPIAPPTERLRFDAIPVSTKRFRYTFGTRLAEEGASKAVIADRLGHVDLQNVDVYFEASPKIVENIDKAMGAQLAPLARAFRGRLVEDEEHSTHQGAPGSRIIDFKVSRAPVGSCGGKGQGCAFNKPVACYTCFKFEPWLDAPHEKVLQRLSGERERFSNDERLAQINDIAIVAVQEVIAECAQVRQQRTSGASQ